MKGGHQRAILEAADQRMSQAIKMVNTVQRALDKTPEGYFISALDLTGNLFEQSTEEVARVVKFLFGGFQKKPERKE